MQPSQGASILFDAVTRMKTRAASFSGAESPASAPTRGLFSGAESPASAPTRGTKELGEAAPGRRNGSLASRVLPRHVLVGDAKVARVR